MSDLVLSLPVRPLPGLTLKDDIVQLVSNAVGRYRHRRLLRRLSRLDARLLIDMGFDPDEIDAAADPVWGPLQPAAGLRSTPWL